MIHTIRTVAVGDQESKIDSPIILYRGDREVEVEFTINGSKFTFTNGGNVIKSTNATHGQLVINTPTGENAFSEVTECHDGKVVFIITKEMIDELIEVGFYSFQIRLFDESQISRVTIPPVLRGIDIRNPIAAEDETNVVDIGLVDYAVVVKDEFEDLSTFLPDGNYNKTEWESKDVISGAKLNKIEDALYVINDNMERSDLALYNRINVVNQDITRQFTELTNDIDEEVEKIERDLNNDIEKFKTDVREEFKSEDNIIDVRISHIAQQNVIDYADFVVNGDWSYAIQEAVNNVSDKGVVYLPQICTIKRTVKINKQISFVGNGQSKIICDYSDWGGHDFGVSIPQKTALYIEGRDPIWLSHLDDMNLNIGGFYLHAINVTDGTIGMYLGTNDIARLAGAPVCVNHAVPGKRFSNIAIYGFETGIEMSEVWESTFEDIIVRGNADVATGLYGILIRGQVVNNFFKNCRVLDVGTGVLITGKTYPNDVYRRPEGLIFEGGLYGQCDTAIYHKDALYCSYTNMVIDLNRVYAMRIANGDCVSVTNCYLYSGGEYTVFLDPMTVEFNSSSTTFTDNKFMGNENNRWAIGNADNWNGLIIKGNIFIAYKRDSCIFLGLNTKCIVTNNVFKNNSITVCIQYTNSTELSEFNNYTRDNNVLAASIDGSYSSTKVNTNINLSTRSIINGDISLDMKNNSFNITIPSYENFKINGSHFLNTVILNDCNQPPLINCFICAINSAANSPGSANWIGHQIVIDYNYVYQELTTQDGTVARRFRTNGVWGSWNFSK